MQRPRGWKEQDIVTSWSSENDGCGAENEVGAGGDRKRQGFIDHDNSCGLDPHSKGSH